MPIRPGTQKWLATVDRVIGKGAAINAEEKEVLVEYLAEEYGPQLCLDDDCLPTKQRPSVMLLGCVVGPAIMLVHARVREHVCALTPRSTGLASLQM